MALDQDEFYRNLSDELKKKVKDNIDSYKWGPKFLDDDHKIWHGEIKHCPTCNDIRITSCCACGCGSCYTCNHKFSCSPYIFPHIEPMKMDQIMDGLGLSKISNEERLSKWIDAIANDNKCTLDDIIIHIQKHFGIELVQEYENGNLAQWLASSENLLDIFKKMSKLNSDTELRLQRLQEQVDRFPDLRTPEPK